MTHFSIYQTSESLLLFAHSYWLTQRWLWLANYYSPPCSWRETKWLNVSLWFTVIFGTLVIQLVWYTLKQYYSPQCQSNWWIFTSPLCSSVNFHNYLPPRWTIVKYNRTLYIYFIVIWVKIINYSILHW